MLFVERANLSKIRYDSNRMLDGLVFAVDNAEILSEQTLVNGNDLEEARQ